MPATATARRGEVSKKARLRRAQRKVMDWATRVAHDEDAMDAVMREAHAWITSVDRLWDVTISAVSCLKNLMLESVTTRHGDRIVTVQEGTWTMPGGVHAPHHRKPHATALMQATIAMLNRDWDMANDILVAHEKVGGAEYLFMVIVEGIDATANMIAATMRTTDEGTEPDDEV